MDIYTTELVEIYAMWHVLTACVVGAGISLFVIAGVQI